MQEIKNHTDLLNFIEQKIQAKSYLEIGVSNGKNFNAIAVPHKIGVDPDLTSMANVHKESDDFFKDNKETFDLIFIDGLHEAEQVKRDIVNSWNSLTEKGVLVIHDTNPEKEEYTHVPRDCKVWNGDVYKTISKTSSYLFTVDFDHGCTIITKRHKLEFSKFGATDWPDFDSGRHLYLNLMSLERGLKIIDSWT